MEQQEEARDRKRKESRRGALLTGPETLCLQPNGSSDSPALHHQDDFAQERTETKGGEWVGASRVIASRVGEEHFCLQEFFIFNFIFLKIKFNDQHEK